MLFHEDQWKSSITLLFHFSCLWSINSISCNKWYNIAVISKERYARLLPMGRVFLASMAGKAMAQHAQVNVDFITFPLSWCANLIKVQLMLSRKLINTCLPPEAMPILLKVIQDPESRNIENLAPTENCISAVAKICKYNGGNLKVDEILPHWLSWLPVWDDEDEAVHVYNYLCDLVESWVFVLVYSRIFYLLTLLYLLSFI